MGMTDPTKAFLGGAYRLPHYRVFPNNQIGNFRLFHPSFPHFLRMTDEDISAAGHAQTLRSLRVAVNLSAWRE